MAIYRRGTAGLTANGVVTGVDTKWQDKLSLIRVGATMVFLTQPLTLVTISAIVSDTEMRAIQTDSAVVPDGTNYVILLHDSITVDGLAQDVAETLRYYQSKETVIEEAMEFFKNFNLQELKDLQAAVRIDADRTAVNANSAEASKNAAAHSASDAENQNQQAYQQRVAAEAAASSAASDSASANASKNAAAGSASSAAADAETAVSAKNAAADSAFNAKTSETNSANSAAGSSQSEQNAFVHRQAAETAANQAGASKDAAKTSETNAANSATSAGQSSAAARDDAARAKAEADRAATANPDTQLKKANNLSDLADVQAARGNLDLDWLRHVGDYNYISSPLRTKRLVLGDDGFFQWQDNNGNVIPVGIGSGGTGATTAEGARNNIGVGKSDTVQFSGVQNIAKSDAAAVAGGATYSTLRGVNDSLRVQAGLYGEVRNDGLKYATLSVSDGSATRYLGYNINGDLSGVSSATIAGTVTAGALVASNGNVEAKQGKSIVVSTQQGGNKNIILQNITGDGAANSWVNLLQGNWYTGYWQLGAIRGSGTDIDMVQLGINNQGNDWKSFQFRNSFGGHLVSGRGFRGQCIQGSWVSSGDYMGAPFNAGLVANNDAGWSPLVSGGTRSSGGYEIKYALGAISSGSAAWPRVGIHMLGDSQYSRGFEFHTTGQLFAWDSGGVWGGNFEFSRVPNSDRDLKSDIVYDDGKASYENLMKIKPSTFIYKSDKYGRVRRGVIAQDMNEIDPEYVKIIPGAPIFDPNDEPDEEGKRKPIDYHDDTLGLDDNVILLDAVIATRYIGGIVDDQKDEIASLKSEIEELKALVSQLISK